MLPGRTGPDLVRELNERNLKALYMSGYSERHVQDRGFDANLHLLEKPFRIEDLLRKVRETLAAPGPT